MLRAAHVKRIATMEDESAWYICTTRNFVHHWQVETPFACVLLGRDTKALLR